MVVHVFDRWDFILCTVSPIKMTTLLQDHNENTVKPACFMFFMKARPVYEISQQYQPTKLTCLTNVTMKSSYWRQNTMSSKRKDSYGILLLHLATSGHSFTLLTSNVSIFLVCHCWYFKWHHVMWVFNTYLKNSFNGFCCWCNQKHV